MDGHFHAEASPKVRPDIQFSVGTEQMVEGIQDNYLHNSLQYELLQDVVEVMSPLYDREIVHVEIDSLHALNQREL